MPFVAQGGQVALRALFRNGASQPVDGTNVAVQLRDPLGAVVYGPFVIPPIVDEPGVGEYSYLWDVGAAEAMGTWIAEWSGLISGADATGVDYVEVVPAGSIITAGSILSLTDVRALIATDLDDVPLQAVIDGESAWLARRVGPLGGPRTERFIWTPHAGWAILRLRRSADLADIEVSDRGTVLASTTWEQRRNGWRICPLVRSWVFPVEVTYTPNDLEVAKRSLLNLVRLALITAGTDGSSLGLSQEVIGSYSYSRSGAGPGSAAAIRSAAVRDLMEPKEPESAIILSSTRVDVREHYTEIVPLV